MPTLEIIMKWKYALGVVDVHSGLLLHAVLYEGRPDEDDMDALEEDMQTDETLIPCIEGFAWCIIELQPDAIESVRKAWMGENPDLFNKPGKRTALN